VGAPATFMGGNNRGSWFVPDTNDEVLVVFEGGNPRRPYIIGGLWNGSDSPPESMDGAGKNFKKVLRSRNGVKITLDDQDGQEQFIVETPGGQKITLKDGPEPSRSRTSNSNSIKLESNGITINAAAKVTITAGGQMDVTAGIVNVSAGMSKFSGVVQCDTLHRHHGRWNHLHARRRQYLVAHGSTSHSMDRAFAALAKVRAARQQRGTRSFWRADDFAIRNGRFHAGLHQHIGERPAQAGRIPRPCGGRGRGKLSQPTIPTPKKIVRFGDAAIGQPSPPHGGHGRQKEGIR